MRVFHLLHDFPPHGHGGVQTYVGDVSRRLAQRHCDVTIVCGSPWSAELREGRIESVGGLRVRRLPRGEDATAHGNSPALRSEVMKAVREERPDVIHLHHWHQLSNDLVRTMRSEGFPVIVTLHDHFASCALFNRLRGDVEVCGSEVTHDDCARCLSALHGFPFDEVLPFVLARAGEFRAEMEAASRLLVLSEAQLRDVKSIPLHRGLEFDVLPLPWPDVPLARPSVRREPSDRLRLACWGGLHPGKGLKEVVSAVGRLARPDLVTITHFGTHHFPEFVEELRRQSSGFDLVLAGRFDYADLVASAPRIDVGVFPSLFRETHGYGVDEAMMLGLPVIVSDRGAPQDRIGTRGLVYRSGDVDALAAILLRMLDDPGELDRLRSGSPAPRATFEEHLDDMLAIYGRAIAQAR